MQSFSNTSFLLVVNGLLAGTMALLQLPVKTLDPEDGDTSVDESDDTLYVWDDGHLVPVDGSWAPRVSPLDLRGLSEFDLAEKEHGTVITIPAAKLAFCYFPKVGCADFNAMFNKANNISAEKIFRQSTPEHLRLDYGQINKEHGWFFASFFRDPLARYLSAFGSKCIPDSEGVLRDDGKRCGGDYTKKPIEKENAIRMFEARAMRDSQKGRVCGNPHWTPQFNLLERCGADKYAPGYANFTGILAGDVHGGVERMLIKVGRKDARALADEFFPPGAIRGHRPAQYVSYDDFYRNSTVVKAVMELYKRDYQLFNSITDP